MSQYIPDLTERFPEGFGGIDMTPSYFGEPVEMPTYFEEQIDESCFEDFIDDPPIPFEEGKQFAVGETYSQVGIFGGVTLYTVKEIDRENQKILLSETWIDVDGSGEREPKWHRLEIDEKGNERALDWSSENFGDIWIYA